MEFLVWCRRCVDISNAQLSQLFENFCSSFVIKTHLQKEKNDDMGLLFVSHLLCLVLVVVGTYGKIKGKVR